MLNVIEKLLLMLTNSIILAISGCDTNLYASTLGPLQIVYVTLTTINGALHMKHMKTTVLTTGIQHIHKQLLR